MKPVIIIGGGWAGLAAAVELCRHSVPVTVLEARRDLGGRARTVRIHNQPIDNGQHLLLGAYHEFLGLLGVIGLSESALFERRPMELCIRSNQHKSIRIALSQAPSPLNLVQGLRSSSGLSVAERLHAVRFCMALVMSRFTLSKDMPMKDWLLSHHQPASLIEMLWEPLCLAALNTHLHEASANIFLRVIEHVFARRASDSNLLLSRTELGSVFPEPAREYVQNHGGQVQIRRRVTEIGIENGAVSGVALDREWLAADHVIVALSPKACCRLLSRQSALAAIAGQINAIPEAPICTVYLQYPQQVSLDAPFVGLTHSTAQWIFDRRRNGQAGLLAIVISGEGPHMAMSKSALCQQIAGELARFFPQWPAPLAANAIREKQATFICNPEIQALRPPNKLPVRGCWLAGDFTDTGYPATLEGAVRSGRAAAHGVLHALGITPQPLPA